MMDWKPFKDDLGGLAVEGTGYHKLAYTVRLSDMPTDVYVATRPHDGSLWISAMGFVWAAQEEYARGRFTYINHYTFAPESQKFNGGQWGPFFQSTGGAPPIPAIQAAEFMPALDDFALFKPEYRHTALLTKAEVMIHQIPDEEDKILEKIVLAQQ